ARVGGIRRAEPAMLHGAISFLVATIVLLALAALGGSVYNGWYAALGPSLSAPAAPGQAVDPSAAKAAATGAMAAAVALLLGLAGSRRGGRAGSGEPRDFPHFKTGRRTARRVRGAPSPPRA